MPRLAYVNGRIVPLAQASVSIEDRAYLFADGIYEVASIFSGALFDWPLHLERMARSLYIWGRVPGIDEASARIDSVTPGIGKPTVS